MAQDKAKQIIELYNKYVMSTYTRVPHVLFKGKAPRYGT